MNGKKIGKKLELVIDKSESMDGWKIETVKNKSMEELKKRLGKNDYAGILAFNTQVRQVHSLVEFTPKNREKIKDSLRNVRADGNTALYDALGEAIDELVDKSKKDDDYKLMVLCLTDGKENSSTRFKKPQDVVDYADSKGVDLEIHIIGIGPDVDEQALGAITDGTDGHYTSASSTSSGVGEAIGEAGKVIGGSSPGGSAEGGTKSGQNKENRAIKKAERCFSMKFEGNISRNKMEHMESVAKKAVGIINEMYPMSAGSVTVPVYLVQKDNFENIFPAVSIDREFCEELFKIFEEEKIKPLEEMQPNVDTRSYSPCKGEPVAKFVSDLEFNRYEDKLTHILPKVTPGIYIKNVTYPGKNRHFTIRHAMNFMAVKSMCYYSTSRSSLLRRRNLKGLDSLMYSVIGLLSEDLEVLEDIIDYSKVVGPWSFPLFLLRSRKSQDPKSVLRHLYKELPVDPLLNGDIYVQDEETYIDYIHSKMNSGDI